MELSAPSPFLIELLTAMKTPSRFRSPLAVSLRLLVASLALGITPVALAATSTSSSSSKGSTTTKIIPPPNNPVTVLLAKYDTDHDGRLDKWELAVMQREDPTAYAQAMAFDKDKKGWLDVADVAAWKNSAAKP